MQLHTQHRLLLLASTHIVALPLYLTMPPPLLIFIISISIWQLAIIKNNYHKPRTAKHYNPSLLIRVCLIVCSFLFLYLSYGAIFGHQSGIGMVILMSLLKMFEIKSRRDTHIIIFTNLFLLATHFFQSQQVWISLYVFTAAIFLITLLVSLSDRQGSMNFTRHFTTTLRLSFASIPFMLILFVLFPRIPGPLWGLPADAFSANSGISEEMSPGSINQLINSSKIAFRVKFEQAPPIHSNLYWRGAVLANYDGKTWRRDDSPASTKLNIHSETSPENYRRYTVTLEPHNLNWLFSLDYPVLNNAPFTINRESMLLSATKVTSIINYSVVSDEFAINQSLFPPEKNKYLQRPYQRNPKTLKFARRMFKKAEHQPALYVSSILQYFRQQDYHYTLSPPKLGKNAMDDFLFSTRRGFCEHYASAFVTLMRAAGIPARIVIGYMGGEMNPVDDYMIVRQSDAHAWTEVWINNRWLRVDPTAAVSPDRVEKGIFNAGLEKDQLPLLLLSNNAFLKQSMYFFDSLQNNWNQWVIGYNQKKQKDFLAQLGLKNTDASNLILWLVLSMSIAALIVGGFVIRQQRKQTDPVQRYYLIFCKKLEKMGFPRLHNEAALEYQNRLRNQTPLPFIETDMLFILSAYRRLRYDKNPSITLKKCFIKRVKDFRARETI